MSMTRKQLKRLAALLDAVCEGLDGKPFRWGGGQRQAWAPMLERAGVELVTRTQIEKRGHRLRRGAQRVGRVYFDAPISREADVFVFGVQTVLDVPKPPAEKGTRWRCRS